MESAQSLGRQSKHGFIRCISPKTGEPVWFYQMTPNNPFETLPAEQVADLKPGQPHHGVNRPGASDPDQRG